MVSSLNRLKICPTNMLLQLYLIFLLAQQRKKNLKVALNIAHLFDLSTTESGQQ